MGEPEHNRRKEDPAMQELKGMIASLSLQISTLSVRLESSEKKVAELVTYLERGKGIWWLFKVGLALTPILSALVTGIWWLIHHLKP